MIEIIHVVNPTKKTPVLEGSYHILPAISGEFWDGVALAIAENSRSDYDSNQARDFSTAMTTRW